MQNNDCDDYSAYKEKYPFYKEHPNDKIWWLRTYDYDGLWLFSFDKEKVYSMFQDYPYKLTEEEKAIFDKENPFWKEFFEDRKNGES